MIVIDCLEAYFISYDLITQVSQKRPNKLKYAALKLRTAFKCEDDTGGVVRMYLKLPKASDHIGHNLNEVSHCTATIFVCTWIISLNSV
jgi:hypothetical protein